MSTPRVTVIGAGIVGAIAAFELSRAGALVKLIDRRREAGRGVTGQSFGWINYVTADPWRDPALYRLRRAAIGKYQKLNSTLGGALFDRACGSLVWKGTEAETVRWVDIHASFGSPTILAERDAIASFVPDYRSAPSLAAYSYDEIAIDPGQAARQLARAAEAAGADIHMGHSVDLVDVHASGQSDVYIGGSRIRSDYVVIAAGTAVGDLMSNYLPAEAIGESPAALVTIDAEHANIECVLKGPDLEVRALDDRTLQAVVGAPDDDSEASRHYIGHAVLETVQRRMPSVGRASVRSVLIGRRPMPADRFPMVGSVPEAPALHLAVAHPGVILAPAIGETIADLILQRPIRPDNEDLLNAPPGNP